MNAETANVAIQFLDRVNLQPQEINAFVAVNNALQKIVEGEQEAAPEAPKEKAKPRAIKKKPTPAPGKAA